VTLFEGGPFRLFRFLAMLVARMGRLHLCLSYVLLCVACLAGGFMAVLSDRKYHPTEHEKTVAGQSSKEIARCLQRGNPEGFSRIAVLDGEQLCEPVIVPKEAMRLFVDLLNHMAQGNIVTLFPIHAELTTQEAADLVNVSRPFLVKQLEAGEIPFTRTGKHRRIRFQDLMDYKERVDRLRDAALDELAALDQELNLGCD
jgi:excisionase family DNA binding protein